MQLACIFCKLVNFRLTELVGPNFCKVLDKVVLTLASVDVPKLLDKRLCEEDDALSPTVLKENGEVVLLDLLTVRAELLFQIVGYVTDVSKTL